MKSTRERRALAAVVRYELAAQAVTELSRAIGAAMTRCDIYGLAMEHQHPGPDTAALWDGQRVKTHLYHAYHVTVDAGAPYMEERTLTKAEQEEYLTAEATGCEHCLTAWQLIEQRRTARRELGLAKLAIRNIGKAELKRPPALEDLAS